jgi:anti-sigma factor RsiW
MWLAFAASAAVIAIVIAPSGLWIRNTQREQILAQLTDMHVSMLASANRVDVISSDRHTVKPWFQGKLPFTFDLPELSGSSYTLVGGRVAYVGHSPGAHLLFELRKHEISVFIFEDAVGAKAYGSRLANAKRLNFSLETWAQDGLRYFVVGDASPADIEGLSRLLKRPS